MKKKAFASVSLKRNFRLWILMGIGFVDHLLAWILVTIFDVFLVGWIFNHSVDIGVFSNDRNSRVFT
jgi:hypothetical protein